LGVFFTRTEKDGFTGFFQSAGRILEKIRARIGDISLVLSIIPAIEMIHHPFLSGLFKNYRIFLPRIYSFLINPPLACSLWNRRVPAFLSSIQPQILSDESPAH
jgi:hypothetical protein